MTGAKHLVGPQAVVPPFKDDPSLACRSALVPDAWFPDSRLTKANKEAIGLCKACPRRRDCLRWALDTGQKFGIYGALTANERKRLLQDLQGRRQ
jgi:WhiB family redox-sensing transcriptional regulator